VKANWFKTTLGAAFSTATGNTPPKNNAQFYGQYMPLVKPPELCDVALDSAEDGLSEAGAAVARTLPPNSILVSCIGNLGKIGLNTVPVAFNQQINAILPDARKALPEFMFYQVLSCAFKDQLEALASGTTVPIVNKSKFNSIEIVLPPLPEQHRIVAILDAAFDHIATARANCEANLLNARAIFESHLQAVFTQRGDGWEVKSFDEVLVIKNGRDQKPVEKIGGKYPIYGSAGNVMGWTDSFICDEQTTIIGRKGTINKPLFIETKFWNVDTAFGLKAKPNLNAKFLYFFCLSYDFSSHNRGTTIPSLVKTDLLNIKISIPSLSVQEALLVKFTALHKETQRLASLYQRKLQALDDLKKSLLHQAFSGLL
jgi:type I restriction enzyme, S subunit